MKRFQLFIRGLATNWTGTVGVVLTTSAFILFVFFELMRMAGILTNSYVGLISYMALPALFILGLILVPIGWWQFRKATGRSTAELLTQRFPDDMTKAKRLGSSLVAMIAVLTIVNVLFLGLGGARMLHFMDSSEFCGTACHKVMNPEWVAYQNSPHAHVACVECHIGEGTEALIDAKLNGLWQVVSATFNLYERPIPTPVHQLRPARETCEHCHWPQKFYGDRIVTHKSFAMDESSTPQFTTLSMKVGGGTGEQAGTIHWHVFEANEVRYQAADEKRMHMDWVEVRRGDSFHRYTNRKLDKAAIQHALPEGEHEPRTMDCVDCHNRATHIYEDPERAVDAALASGAIDRTLPYAKKVALEALTGTYTDKDAAMTGIDNAVRGFYLRDLDDAALAGGYETDAMIETLQDIYARNIFPIMNVQWNTYPSHLGHSNETNGCFRCHNANMTDDDGQAIPYDCTLCHSKYLQDEFLGVEADAPQGYVEPAQPMEE